MPPTLPRGLLLAYTDREAAQYLLDGFKSVFQIPVQGARQANLASNQKSVKGMEDVVRQKIEKNLAEGRATGPFQEPPVPNLHASPLRIILRKGARRIPSHSAKGQNWEKQTLSQLFICYQFTQTILNC